MHGHTDVMTLFLDSLSPKTEKLSLEEAMDLSRDRLILELEDILMYYQFSVSIHLSACH
jgi:hypothetical protein